MIRQIAGGAAAVLLLACGHSDATVSADAATLAFDGGADAGGPQAPDASTRTGDAAIDAATFDAGAGPHDGSTDAKGALDGAGALGDASTHAVVAVPMYVDPSASPTLWSEAFDAGAAVGLLVANPDNGPGTAVDSQYTAAIASAHGAGQLIIGYVHTSSGSRALKDVETDVDSWYSFYPGIDGIFIDECASDVSTVSSYYVPLYSYIVGKPGVHRVALNPGMMVDESFLTATDILVTFEDTYSAFLDPSQNPPNPAWVASYPPTRFWNLILSADAGVLAAAVTGAKARNAGFIYVTAEGPSTAYQNIETGSYWSAELSDVTAP